MYQKEIEIKGRLIGGEHTPLILGEMACAHNGHIDEAKALIDAIATSGADAIQLQPFSTPCQVSPLHKLHPILEGIEFSKKEWSDIFSHAHSSGLIVFAFSYDIPSLELALELGIDGIKLSSADLSNPEMLIASAQSGMPISLGTGASTLQEIGDALHLIEQNNGEKVILMHGVQNFPTSIADANLRRIQLLKSVFPMPVGYQDHTDGDLEIAKLIDLTAVGLGAHIIEKHVTLDRSEKGIDYQAALEPAEWKPFVAHLKQVFSALGTGSVQPLNASDKKYRQFQKKVILAAEAIPAGKPITREKLTFLRLEEGGGLPPNEIGQLLGKKTSRDILQYAPLALSDVQAGS